jgi:hypothetical protein
VKKLGALPNEITDIALTKLAQAKQEFENLITGVNIE